MGFIWAAAILAERRFGLLGTLWELAVVAELFVQLTIASGWSSILHDLTSVRALDGSGDHVI